MATAAANTTHPPLIRLVLPLVRAGDRVLDLGAGAGKQVQLFQKAGARVTAVDRKPPPQQGLGINWNIESIEDYLSSLPQDEIFHVVFMQNVLQFLPYARTTDTVLPLVQRHTMSGGIVALRTFWHNPEPPFPKPCASLYTLNDLWSRFVGWKTLISQQFEQDGHDLAGQTRHFYLTDLIVRKAP